MIKRLIFYFPRYFSPLWFFVILMTRNKNCYTQNEFFKNAKLIDYIFHHFLYVINILFKKKKKKRTFNFILQVVKVKYNNSRYNYPTMLIIHDTYPFSRRNQRLFHPMKRVFHHEKHELDHLKSELVKFESLSVSKENWAVEEGKIEWNRRRPKDWFLFLKEKNPPKDSPFR